MWRLLLGFLQQCNQPRFLNLAWESNAGLKLILGVLLRFLDDSARFLFFPFMPSPQSFIFGSSGGGLINDNIRW